jgi:hypothetical protein
MGKIIGIDLGTTNEIDDAAPPAGYPPSGTVTQTYAVINGQANLLTSSQHMGTTPLDPNFSDLTTWEIPAGKTLFGDAVRNGRIFAHNESYVENKYDEVGNLDESHSAGESYLADGTVNRSIQNTIFTTAVIQVPDPQNPGATMDRVVRVRGNIDGQSNRYSYGFDGVKSTVDTAVSLEKSSFSTTETYSLIKPDGTAVSIADIISAGTVVDYPVKVRRTNVDTTSDSKNRNGSDNHQRMVTVYRYDGNGVLVYAHGETPDTDPFVSHSGYAPDNVTPFDTTTGKIVQDYEIIRVGPTSRPQDQIGVARLDKVTTTSSTTRRDGSSDKSTSILDYTNNQVTTRLVSAKGDTDTVSIDKFKNVSGSHTDQYYGVYANIAKPTVATTKSWSMTRGDTPTGSYLTPGKNSDGSTFKQEVTVTNTYDKYGRLNSAVGNGTSLSFDGFKGYTAGTMRTS